MLEFGVFFFKLENIFLQTVQIVKSAQVYYKRNNADISIHHIFIENTRYLQDINKNMSADRGDETIDYINWFKNAITIRKTLSGINLFTRLISGNNDIRSLDDIPVMELDRILARFLLMKITKDDGSPYEPSTIKPFQSSISRHLLDTRKLCIIKDKESHHSREILSAKTKDLKSMVMGANKRRADSFHNHSRQRKLMYFMKRIFFAQVNSQISILLNCKWDQVDREIFVTTCQWRLKY